VNDSGTPNFNSPRKAMKEPLPDISALMIPTKEGGPKAVLANAITALRYDPAWWDVLAFNEFTLYPTTKKPAPWQKDAGRNWSDYDDSRCADWLQHAGILVNSKVAAKAVQVVGKENSFHLVKDFLTQLQWDNEPRLDTWLVQYLGSEDTPFSRAIGARWLRSRYPNWTACDAETSNASRPFLLLAPITSASPTVGAQKRAPHLHLRSINQ
jgi:hypothetical protein